MWKYKTQRRIGLLSFLAVAAILLFSLFFAYKYGLRTHKDFIGLRTWLSVSFEDASWWIHLLFVFLAFLGALAGFPSIFITAFFLFLSTPLRAFFYVSISQVLASYFGAFLIRKFFHREEKTLNDTKEKESFSWVKSFLNRFYYIIPLRTADLYTPCLNADGNSSFANLLAAFLGIGFRVFIQVLWLKLILLGFFKIPFDLKGDLKTFLYLNFFLVILYIVQKTPELLLYPKEQKSEFYRIIKEENFVSKVKSDTIPQN